MLAVTLLPVASIISFGTWLAFLATGVCVCALIWYVEERIRSARLAIFCLKRDRLYELIQNQREEAEGRYRPLPVGSRLTTVMFKLEDLSVDLPDARIHELRRRIDILERLRHEVANCADYVVSRDDLVADLDEIRSGLEDAAASRQRMIEKVQAKYIADSLYRKRMHQKDIASLNESWDAHEARLRRHESMLTRELGEHPAT
jgi:hypothetical protein